MNGRIAMGEVYDEIDDIWRFCNIWKYIET